MTDCHIQRIDNYQHQISQVSNTWWVLDLGKSAEELKKLEEQYSDVEYSYALIDALRNGKKWMTYYNSFEEQWQETPITLTWNTQVDIQKVSEFLENLSTKAPSLYNICVKYV